MGLSHKQQLFVDAYLLHGNASQAYIQAGYSPKNPNVGSANLVANISIKAAIAEGKKKIAEQALWTREKATSVLLNVIATADKKSDVNGAVKILNEMTGINEPQKLQHSNDPNNPLSISLNFVGKKAPTNGD